MEGCSFRARRGCELARLRMEGVEESILCWERVIVKGDMVVIAGKTYRLGGGSSGRLLLAAREKDQSGPE